MAEAEALRAQMEEEMAREMAEYERKVSFFVNSANFELFGFERNKTLQMNVTPEFVLLHEFVLTFP